LTGQEACRFADDGADAAFQPGACTRAATTPARRKDAMFGLRHQKNGRPMLPVHSSVSGLDQEPGREGARDA
jgi:hypothetical protein